ncbi:hypothetical protein [Thiohalocapsa sp.]|jgi:ABC-type phosphate transport system substrate-binding protein|uniref:hypothetical protein n=1 Tax=Thiohalocapsa sp. TaxID=2497641 RepID=UPI0025ECD31C|nr:hypothetical protein [Thiohalocapsa sp.]
MLLLCSAATWAAQSPPHIDVVTGAAPIDLRLDRSQLRDIFLKRVVIDRSGTALVPLNMPPDHPLRAAFSEALLGKTPEALRRFWNERYFQGVSPPYVVRSQEAMLRFVTETPGALGYVVSCRADERVRVVAELPVPQDLADAVAALCAASQAGR